MDVPLVVGHTMAKPKRELVIVAILGVILFLMVMRTIGIQRKKSAVLPQEAESTVQATTGEASDTLPPNAPPRERKVSYRGKDFRDPMTKPASLLAILAGPLAKVMAPETPGMPEEDRVGLERGQVGLEVGQVGLEVGQVGLEVGQVGLEEAVEIAKPSRPLSLEPPTLDIKGVIWGIDPAQVIIGDKVVSVGEAVGEIRIKGADQEGILVEYQGWDFVLKVLSKDMLASSIATD